MRWFAPLALALVAGAVSANGLDRDLLLTDAPAVPDKGTVLVTGRRFGQFELALNGVFGVETGVGSGKDIEVKGFAGWRFNDAVRAGLDSRFQTEAADAEGAKPVNGGRDYDLTTAPALSWML